MLVGTSLFQPQSPAKVSLVPSQELKTSLGAASARQTVVLKRAITGGRKPVMSTGPGQQSLSQKENGRTYGAEDKAGTSLTIAHIG